MKPAIKKKNIYIFVVILSIIIYFTGVLSGLYANKVIERKVQEDVSFLKDQIDKSSLDVKNIALLQFMVENVDDQCKFSNLYLEHLYDQLKPFWDILPSRMEAYEKQGSITEEYISIKREYIRLSLRIWLTNKNNIKECGESRFIPVLYFYSKGCVDCIEQGEMLDKFNSEMKRQGKTVLVFPIDANFPDDSVYLLKQYYNITSEPAVIIGKDVYQGRVTDLTQT